GPLVPRRPSARSTASYQRFLGVPGHAPRQLPSLITSPRPRARLRTWALDRGVGPFEHHRGAHPLPAMEADAPVLAGLAPLGAPADRDDEGGGHPLRPDERVMALGPES